MEAKCFIWIFQLLNIWKMRFLETLHEELITQFPLENVANLGCSQWSQVSFSSNEQTCSDYHHARGLCFWKCNLKEDSFNGLEYLKKCHMSASITSSWKILFYNTYYIITVLIFTHLLDLSSNSNLVHMFYTKVERKKILGRNFRFSEVSKSPFQLYRRLY